MRRTAVARVRPVAGLVVAVALPHRRLRVLRSRQTVQAIVLIRIEINVPVFRAERRLLVYGRSAASLASLASGAPGRALQRNLLVG